MRGTLQFWVGWFHGYRNRSETLEVRLLDSPFSVGDGRTFTAFGNFHVRRRYRRPGEDSLDLAGAICVDCGEHCSLDLDSAARVGRSDDSAQFGSSFRF